MLKEFKEFALKGNMVDLAVGFIIGVAFAAIVSSLVDDVFMPVIGLIFGGLDFTNLFIVLSNPQGIDVTTLEQAQEAGLSTLNLGLFINAVVKFVLIALVLFFTVKAINSMRREAEEEAPPAPPEPSAEEKLLTEIRDLLAKS